MTHRTAFSSASRKSIISVIILSMRFSSLYAGTTTVSVFEALSSTEGNSPRPLQKAKDATATLRVTCGKHLLLGDSQSGICDDNAPCLRIPKVFLNVVVGCLLHR